MSSPYLRPVITALTVCAFLGLTACAPMETSEDHGPEASPLSSPPARPGLPSEEDALTASAALVADYNRSVIAATADPSVDASVLGRYLTEQRLDEVRAWLDRVRSDGRHFAGTASYTNVSIQELDHEKGRLVTLSCEDISRLRMLDSAGADVTAPERTDKSTLQTTFLSTPDGLRIDSVVVWEGASSC